MADMMNIGVRSLSAYKSALSVASDNIANANTPGYSRREISFTESPFSNGVSISGIQQVFDQNANNYAQISNSFFEEHNSYLQQLRTFEPLIDNDTDSIRKYLTDSMGSLEQLNTDPSSARNRALFMGKLANLVDRFQGVNTEINRQISNVNQSLQTNVTNVNQLLSNLTEINNRMVSSQGADITALVDNRQSLIQQLSKYFDFTVQINDHNLVSVSLSNGLSLLAGNQPTLFLTTLPDPSNPANLSIAASAGSVNVPLSDLIHSGQIAGLLNFRENALGATQRSLGVLSLGFSSAFNTQNKLGIDTGGNIGGNIFNDINSSAVISNRILDNTTNAGSLGADVVIDDVSKLSTSDYSMVMGAANSYVLTRSSDNTVVSSGTLSGPFPQALVVGSEGFTITVSSGTFTSGDQYIVSPSYGAINNMNLAINDSAKIALAWPVTANPDTQNKGTATTTVTNIVDTTNAAFTTPQQLTPPIQVEFLTATTYQLVNVTTSAVIEGPLVYDPTTGADLFPTAGSYDPGYRVSLKGTPQAGDLFNISFNTNSASDNRNGLAMEDLYSAGVLQGGQNTLINFNQAYDLINSDIAIKTNSAQIALDSAKVIKDGADQTVDSISGVNVEDETINLARFQQAYQASAQILQAAKAVLDTIIGLSRR